LGEANAVIKIDGIEVLRAVAASTASSAEFRHSVYSVRARILNLLNIPQDMLPRWGEHHFGGEE
jgi:3-polyprenyl-4-hydroxybenzoate decarboxylase